MNALERLAHGYEAEEATARRDLAIAEGQLRDHTDRLGKVFPHGNYQTELTELRDRLKDALSATREASAGGRPAAAELAERILALKAQSSALPAIELPSKRRGSGERPVTARIRKPGRLEPTESESVIAETTSTAPAAPVETVSVPREVVETPRVTALPPGRPAQVLGRAGRGRSSNGLVCSVPRRGVQILERRVSVLVALALDLGVGVVEGLGRRK